MYLNTGEDRYRDRTINFINNWLPGGGIPYTPRGLAFRSAWGSNRYSGKKVMIEM